MKYIPASLQSSRTLSEPVNPAIHQKPAKGNVPNKRRNAREKNEGKKKPAKDYVIKPTFDIPLGRRSTSAKSTSPAIYERAG